jgi:tetratricopeptide (TPR) repeat protein
VALLFLAYLGTIVLTVASDRARLPLVPLLAPFAGWALVWAVRAAESRSRDALVRLAPALLVGVLAVHVRTLPDSEVDEDLDERDYNLAVQLVRDEGRTDEARVIAERLVRDHPRSARTQILLSEIDLRDAAALTISPDAATRGAGRARLDAAIAQVEPLAREPSLNERERFRAASLCGWIQLERGAWADAAAAFRQARAFDGEARELREGLARALLGTADAGQMKEVRAAAEEALALLRNLRSTAVDTGEAAGLEGLLALAEYLRGRAILEAPSSSDDERKLGQSSLQSALTRLQPLAGSLSIAPEVSWRCRLLAGAIQLYLRNWKQAESHFRSALALHEDPEPQLGLLQALVGALEDESQTDGRSSRIEEASRLFEQLAATDPDAPAIPDLRRRFDLLH